MTAIAPFRSVSSLSTVQPMRDATGATLSRDAAASHPLQSRILLFGTIIAQPHTITICQDIARMNTSPKWCATGFLTMRGGQCNGDTLHEVARGPRGRVAKVCFYSPLHGEDNPLHPMAAF